ncbi:O-antigen ligase family protein [Knoellia aerolata]|uniref:O-antigen ligase family protein n=1 Tax=Knoellia aerolata TaxID=442954 RepID=UPI00147077C7|nr:O-antigen ligase family protein [Knoellia aerolata]
MFADQVGPAMSGFKVVLGAAVVILLTQSAVKERPEAGRRLVLAVSVGSVIVSAMVLLAVADNPGSFANSAGAKEQSDLSFGGSNYLAALIVLGLSATAGSFLVTRGGTRKLLLLGVPVQLLAVVATGSRGQTAALGVVWVAVVWISIRASRRAAVVTIGGLLVSGGVALFTLGDWLIQIWQPALAGGARNYSTAQARFDIWATAIETFRANPVIGVGLRNFEWRGDFAYAHNWVLQLMAETGLVGLGVFVLIVVRARAITPPASRPMLHMVLVVAAASGSLEPTILTRDYDYLFWIIVVAVAHGALTASERLPESSTILARRGKLATQRPMSVSVGS